MGPGLIVLALLVTYAIYIFNVLTRLRQLAANAWADIDVQLKRRHDLIPNLLETVKGYAGHEKHPAWFINLRDRNANPEVYVKVQDGEFWSVPDILDGGPDHDRIWELLCDDRAWYRDYQKKCDRTIPLVRLPETRSV